MQEEQAIDTMFDDGQPVTQPKTFKFDESKYLNTRLGPNEAERKMKIRIILTKDTVDGKDKVAIPVKIHSVKLSTDQKSLAKSGFKSFICLNDDHMNEHEEAGCPLCNKSKELFALGNNTDDPVMQKSIYKEAYTYRPKTAYIVRCVDRAHEDEGVKFWRFNAKNDGTGCFDMLKNLASQRNAESKEYQGKPYNMFDYEEGRDLILTLTRSKSDNPNAPEKTGIVISDVAYNTPLSKDKEQADAWINDENDWKDMYRVKSYDYMKIVADGGLPVYDKSAGTFVPMEKENQEE